MNKLCACYVRWARRWYPGVLNRRVIIHGVDDADDTMQQLYNAWRARPVHPGHCVACALPTTAQFCSRECGTHFERLACLDRLQLSEPGGMKRLLEVVGEDDVWQQMPDDLIVALLHVTYPLRERDERQFRQLAAWRHMNRHYKRIIDSRVYPAMQALPESFTMVNDAALALFPSLQRLTLVGDGPATEDAVLKLQHLNELQLRQSTIVSYAGLQQLSQLTRLALYPAWHGGAIRVPPLAQLQHLVLAWNAWLDMDDFRQLTNLRVLRLPANQRMRFIPTSLTALRKLQISTSDVIDLGDLTSLDALIVGFNERVTDDHLLGLTQLQRLDLQHTPHVNRVSHLVNLTRLNLESNRSVVADDLLALSRLTRLDLSSSDAVTDAILSQLTTLRDLNLNSNSRVSDDGLRPLTQLERLALARHHGGMVSHRGVNASRVTDQALHALPLLHTLNLEQNDMITSQCVAALTQLTDLDLRHNIMVSDQAVEQLPRLRRLVLHSNTRITGDVLRNLPLLTELHVRRSLITAADLDRWLSPQCLVIRDLQ